MKGESDYSFVKKKKKFSNGVDMNGFQRYIVKNNIRVKIKVCQLALTKAV